MIAEATTIPTPVSEASISPADFLAALVTFNFNLPQVASTLTPDQLLAFTSDPDIREKLQSLLDFNTLCLSLRQTKERHLALDTLHSLLKSTDDPVEKRRAATSLLRATTSPRSPGRGAEPPRGGEGSDDRPRPPRPSASPRADLTAEKVIEELQRAMYFKNQHEENAGLATIAAFCDDDAALDGDTLPTDNVSECIEALEDSDLKDMQTTVQYWTLTAEASIQENDAVIHAVFACQRDDSPLKVTFTLARRDVSKHPGCWLITSMTTGIYRNTS